MTRGEVAAQRYHTPFDTSSCGHRGCHGRPLRLRVSTTGVIVAYCIPHFHEACALFGITGATVRVAGEGVAA